MASRGNPFEILRQLALSLERHAAEGISSGVVRGTGETLQKELPDVDLRKLAEDGLTFLAGVLHQAAKNPEGATFMEREARAAMRGAFSELRESMPELAELGTQLVAKLSQGAQRTSGSATTLVQV